MKGKEKLFRFPQGRSTASLSLVGLSRQGALNLGSYVAGQRHFIHAG